jgi:hypothetical protein
MLFAGILGFIIGFMTMLCIHSVIVDVYHKRHLAYVRKLKHEPETIEIIERHVYAVPEEVENVRFGE